MYEAAKGDVRASLSTVSSKTGGMFFIDDLLMNVEGARECGMDGYCFADRNIEALKECLSKLNN